MEIEDAKKLIIQVVESKVEKAKDILSVIETYFGEENVDNDLNEIINNIVGSSYFNLDGDSAELEEKISEQCDTSFVTFTVKIHWPKITVENEKKNTIDIYDLFCIMSINVFSGALINIRFTKSTYTKKQFKIGYVHSHLQPFSGIDRRLNPIEYNARASKYNEWKRFCFGIGPIRNTFSRVEAESVDENDYMLLCRELDICVRIESLAGGPYMKMSSVLYHFDDYHKVSENDTINKNSVTEFQRKFISYFLKNADLSYVYGMNGFDINCSFEDFALIATKMFFKFVKENMESVSKNDIKSSVCSVVRKNGKFKINKNDGEENVDYIDWINSNNIEIIEFKGEVYPLRIIDDDRDKRERKMMLLDKTIVTYLLRIIVTMINSNISIDGKRKEYESAGVADGENSEAGHEKVSYKFIV